ncbi:hypothetical protein [Acinetobacter sp.]|uniref:hypothetical protein n=1 Tax=Acinetobacter sp. TaxID=472 RepID=UPI00388D15F7
MNENQKVHGKAGLKAAMSGELSVEQLETEELVLLEHILFQATEAQYIDQMAPANDLIH